MSHLDNTKIALSYWLTVPLDNVVADLSVFRCDVEPTGFDCGTIACFGGWVPAMPEFAAMGVTADENGAPEIGRLWGASVARKLFGKRDLFYARKYFELCSYDKSAPSGCSDKELVTHRLKEHIKYLENKV